MPEPELEQSFETIDGYQRKSWCDIEGEGIKKWKEALIVLKNNLLFVYKNESAKNPQLLIGLDKCLVMTAEEYDGKTNVIQLKTATGRIFCLSLPPREELSAWVADIKGSDYASLKEKVTTLEMGLKTIGEDQNRRMKTDQEKAHFLEKQRAVFSIQRIQSELRFQILYQALMKWKTNQELQGMKQRFEEAQRDKTKYYERELVLLKEQSSNAEKEASEKMKSVSYDCKQYIIESGVHRLNRLLVDEKQFKQLLTLLMWKEKSRLLSFQKAAEKEKEALQSEVETLRSTITERESALTTLKEEVESVKKQMKEEAQSHQDLVKEHVGMKDALEQVMQSKEAVEAQNRKLIEQIEQNTASLAAFQEAANGSEEEATAVVARLQIEVNELRSKLEASQKDEEEYRRKWEMLQDFSVEELSRAQKKIDEYAETCSSLVKQVEEANNGEKLTTLLREKEELDARVKELEVQVKATVDVVNCSSEMAIERENEMEMVKGKSDVLEKELKSTKEAWEKEAKEAKEAKKNYEEQIRALEEKNDAQKKELSTLKRRVLALKNMEESMKDIEDLLQQREAQLKDVLERIKAAERASEESKKEAKRYEARNAELERQMQNYTFRESEAGEVVEKVVEVQKDKPETLARVKELEDGVAALEKEKEALEKALAQKAEEEEKQKKRDEEFKLKKPLPLKVFPLYPSLRPTDEETSSYAPKVVKVEVEARPEEEKDVVTKCEGRNPDVVRKEEEERRRKEEEERKRKEEEERRRKEEEERLRREEEERKKKEEEERKRREEEERKRKEEEERRRKEEEEKKKKEEEGRKGKEEEERRKKEEEERLKREEEERKKNEETVKASNPFDEDAQEPAQEPQTTANPFDQPSVEEEHRVSSPNPFDQPSEEEESIPAPNPFNQPSEEPETATSNPFDQPVEEPEETSSNPFDQPSVEEEHPVASSNPFDQPSEEPASTPNPFDQPSVEPVVADANPFAQSAEDLPTPANQPSAEPSNPFDQPSAEPAEAPQPIDASLFDLTPAQPSNPFAQPAEDSNPFAQPTEDSNPFAQPAQPAQPTQPAQQQTAASPSLFGTSPAKEDSVAFDFSSVISQTEKQAKPSLWKRKKSEKKEKEGESDGKKKWGFGSKQVDAIKGGMGRFGHMLKSAAAKGQNVIASKKGEEPEFFPDMDMSDLEEGFDAKAVKFFFAHWNASMDEKVRLREWMAPIINNEILTHEVLEGYTIKGASPFVEGAFRLCITPLLSLRKDISVDFMELPSEEGVFELDIKLRMKDDPMENLLGFD